MEYISKSYYYYHILFEVDDIYHFKHRFFFNEGFSYFFSYPKEMPEYMQQGTCDVLDDEKGLAFNVFQTSNYPNLQLFDDYSSCFVYHFPFGDEDRLDDQVYKHNYTFACDPEKLSKGHSMSIFSSELYDDLGEWANILKLNPDFFYVRSEHKIILASKDFKQVKNWLKIYRGEMTFSEYDSIPNYRLKRNLPIKEDENKTVASKRIKLRKSTLNASINLEDYITPEIIGLLDIESNNRPSSAKTNRIEFEELVADAFNLLGFEVDQLEQDSGKEANTIIKLRGEDRAFIVDAKAYSNGYDLVMNDRAFRENAQFICHKLSKIGYHKLGYVMVNNFFKSNFDGLINTITRSTDINKIILLESEALLYLLAYKTKDKLSLSNMIDKLAGIANPVKAQNIIEVFDNI